MAFAQNRQALDPTQTRQANIHQRDVRQIRTYFVERLFHRPISARALKALCATDKRRKAVADLAPVLNYRDFDAALSLSIHCALAPKISHYPNSALLSGKHVICLSVCYASKSENNLSLGPAQLVRSAHGA